MDGLPTICETRGLDYAPSRVAHARIYLMHHKDGCVAIQNSSGQLCGDSIRGPETSHLELQVTSVRLLASLRNTIGA
jgi:hypothetical protein